MHLHEVVPREQVGPATGERYDFQYHQAAADCLQVLDDTQVACVYCEWHDDYVIETAGVISYRFHQVKTRLASLGPWTLKDSSA
jgi:Cap4 dsDNA endonuclease